MDDRLLVEALRERDPAAPAAVYDAYAGRLYEYCWSRLRDRDAAQAALRDSFIVAEAHIGRLRDADRFRGWLYAIARLECARRLPGRDQPPDLPVASHDQDDVDQRVMAWQAVQALEPLSRELLDLRVRHQLPVPDLAAVVGLPAKEAESRLQRAHAELEAAVTAEILAHKGPYGCAERGALLRQRRGPFTGDLNERLLRHARECDACQALGPRTVSAVKVFGLLPRIHPPASLRARVTACFHDPELVGYRLFVATRVGAFGPAGFPKQSRHFASSPRRALPHVGRRPAAGRAVAAVAVVAVLLGGGGLAFHRLTAAEDGTGTAASEGSPRPSVPSASPSPTRSGRSPRADVGSAPVSATFPLGARVSSAPPTALLDMPGVRLVDYEDPRSRPAGLTVAPLYLDLAGATRGTLHLTAEGGSVNWRAKPWGPIRLGRTSGRIAAGRTVTLDVVVTRPGGSAGEGGVVFAPGGVGVRVTWRRPAPPDPTARPRPGGAEPTMSTPQPPPSAPPPADRTPPDPPPSETSTPPSPSSREPDSPPPPEGTPLPQGSGT
ncbi:sigma-70 family RNA polymerase sigma factor [Actinomadura keratinilytica]|jgi:DNA-directed RNA polymerase specialized sigma24 family protein|uniref:Sigma-70 family RNA polymerase sigma factor n=1 Tax=Actinomadura keratinilytica TaxID=547461 RepID=A0ABP7Y7X6_9ACTN